MYRLFAKLGVLALYSYAIYNFYAQAHAMGGAWVASIGIFVLGLASLDPKWATKMGSDGAPGLLQAFTLMLLFGPFAFFYLVPLALAEYEITPHTPHFSRLDMISLWIASAAMAFSIWVPMLAYLLIDFIADRLPKREAAQA